jgi:alkylation response protein AidB-like acyl-CoA dehydrogenase
MDFRDSVEESIFRSEARAWFERMAARFDLATHPGMTFEEQLRLGREFQAEKAAAGYAKPEWSHAHGGRDASAVESVICAEEERRFTFPNKFFAIGLGMPIPIMRRYASVADRERFLGPALRGEEIWCQLFSEPTAGSDLGAVRLRADRNGDEWILNGQKIWTSWAHVADFGTILARSDPSLPKHAGLTFFYVNMKTPGISVRQINQMSGAREFCEVFFTDVRIPDTNRLGEVNGGWRVTVDTLMEERFTLQDPTYGAPPLTVAMKFLRDNVRSEGATGLDDGALRERFAEWYCIEQGLRNIYARMVTALSRGSVPGPEAALTKLVLASKVQAYSAAMIDANGPAGVITVDKEMPGSAGCFCDVWLQSAGMRIAGGTDEILRNTIAERVLLLPAEIRTDKNVAFSDL